MASSPPPTCPAARRRPSSTSLSARTWSRSSPTPARTTTRGLPRYVEQEFRAYIRCGTVREGFSRAHCDACGHDLLVAFSCHGRSICPSCCGRRMANVAAHLVDRVLPDVPVRQYVLIAAVRAAQARRVQGRRAHGARAHLRRGHLRAATARAPSAPGSTPGSAARSVCVQRFGSLNLNVHFHCSWFSTACSRATRRGACSSTLHRRRPSRDLGAIVERTERRAGAWLRRHGYIDERPLEERSSEPERRPRSTRARPSPWDAATSRRCRAPAPHDDGERGPRAAPRQGRAWSSNTMGSTCTRAYASKRATTSAASGSPRYAAAPAAVARTAAPAARRARSLTVSSTSAGAAASIA